MAGVAEKGMAPWPFIESCRHLTCVMFTVMLKNVRWHYVGLHCELLEHEHSVWRRAGGRHSSQSRLTRKKGEAAGWAVAKKGSRRRSSTSGATARRPDVSLG